MADADLSLRDDVEKAAYRNDKSSDEASPAPGYDYDSQVRRGSVMKRHEGFFSAFTLNSFKRNPMLEWLLKRPTWKVVLFPEPALAMKLKPRHLQIIAVGGTIGMFSSHISISKSDRRISCTGLFVGSGSALTTGGPTSLIIAYGLIGVMLFCTVHALGELAVAFPIVGAFSVYSSRFIHPAWGFAMGWK